MERLTLEFDQPAGQLVVNTLLSTDTSDIHSVNINNLLTDNRKVFSLPVEATSSLTMIPSVDSRDIFGYVGLDGALSITGGYTHINQTTGLSC